MQHPVDARCRRRPGRVRSRSQRREQARDRRGGPTHHPRPGTGRLRWQCRDSRHRRGKPGRRHPLGPRGGPDAVHPVHVGRRRQGRQRRRDPRPGEHVRRRPRHRRLPLRVGWRSAHSGSGRARGALLQPLAGLRPGRARLHRRLRRPEPLLGRGGHRPVPGKSVEGAQEAGEEGGQEAAQTSGAQAGTAPVGETHGEADSPALTQADEPSPTAAKPTPTPTHTPTPTATPSPTDSPSPGRGGEPTARLPCMLSPRPERPRNLRSAFGVQRSCVCASGVVAASRPSSS